MELQELDTTVTFLDNAWSPREILSQRSETEEEILKPVPREFVGESSPSITSLKPNQYMDFTSFQ